jgi:hypothetical protein
MKKGILQSAFENYPEDMAYCLFMDMVAEAEPGDYTEDEINAETKRISELMNEPDKVRFWKKFNALCDNITLL